MGPQDVIADFPLQLESGATYVVVANGIVSASGYIPSQPFQLYVNEGREMANEAGNTDVLVFHGATDAPVVDVSETAVLEGTTIVDDMAYGEFQGYLEVPALDFVLQVETSDGTPLVAHQAPLNSLGLADAAIVVLASGFLDPSMNSNGEPFGLYVALPAGGPLVALPLSTNVLDLNGDVRIHMWPNPAVEQLHFEIPSLADGPMEILLHDAHGRLASTHNMALSGGRMTLDVNGMPAGLYMAWVISGGSSLTMPVIIGQ